MPNGQTPEETGEILCGLVRVCASLTLGFFAVVCVIERAQHAVEYVPIFCGRIASVAFFVSGLCGFWNDSAPCFNYFTFNGLVSAL